MSVFREEKPLNDNERVTFEDSKIIKHLMESNKLTQDEKDSIYRLYITYQYLLG